MGIHAAAADWQLTSITEPGSNSPGPSYQDSDFLARLCLLQRETGTL
jgi:hypothetical protein